MLKCLFFVNPNVSLPFLQESVAGHSWARGIHSTSSHTINTHFNILCVSSSWSPSGHIANHILIHQASHACYMFIFPSALFGSTKQYTAGWRYNVLCTPLLICVSKRELFKFHSVRGSKLLLRKQFLKGELPVNLVAYVFERKAERLL
jgi:hypothetical protein